MMLSRGTFPWCLALHTKAAAFMIRLPVIRCGLSSAVGLMLMILSRASIGGQMTPASLVLVNGKIVTVDDSLPEAQAVAVQGDTIVAVGSNYAIRPYCGPRTRMIDLQGDLAVPGFIEGHGHFLNLGLSKIELDLTKARNWGAIVHTVEEAVKKAKPGEWIVGRGWHQEMGHDSGARRRGLSYP